MNRATHLARIEFHWTRIRRRGAIWTLRWIGGRLARFLAWFPLLPAGLLLHLLGYRRLGIFTDRIGHLSGETDCFLKERALGRLPARRWFLLAPPHRAANSHLIGYIGERLETKTNRWTCAMLDAMSQRNLMRRNVTDYMLVHDGTARMYEINSAWGKRPPLFALRSDDRKLLTTTLAKHGFREDDWFVCVHARESSFSPDDESLHAYRNGTLTNLLPAIEAITARGGWCVRVGSSGGIALPAMPRVIDYAASDWRSPRMDVCLCAGARFLVGNSSGLFALCTAFGVPCMLVNMAPASVVGLGYADLSIPKLHWSHAAGRLLSFAEVMASPLSHYRFSTLFRDARVELWENSPEEIVELVDEMLDRLEGRFVAHPDDASLQAAYLSLFRPGHYGFGACSRIGAAFLRRHRALLGR